ncbi:helix-turn-helix domain-containing protein [Bryobacter aggregatus]|uniref:helix-turn-helix domain-containing protein n=1 Tax=Bryobacter aggregatus TaxID=360054 RepID=UPI0004E164B7|nr:helix-turn-helix transcriptional regulator [Bryobacter aggregatus]
MAAVSAPSKTVITSDEAGQKLRKARERLGLKFREVEVASQRIAERHSNEEYSIGLSRLSEIENKGVLPSLFRLYSLATIYRLDFLEVLSWYGIALDEQATDANLHGLEQTHSIHFAPTGFGEVQAPLSLDPGVDLRQTTFLSRVVTRWGALPLQMLNQLDTKRKHYAFLGTEDWSMYPILRPGSLLLINETNKIVNSGWADEWDRPIYFLEHRHGYECGWCHLDRDRLMVISHPSAAEAPKVYLYPNEIEVVGRVVGVAMELAGVARPRQRNADA